jgi:hypothetical protein
MNKRCKDFNIEPVCYDCEIRGTISICYIEFHRAMINNRYDRLKEGGQDNIKLAILNRAKFANNGFAHNDSVYFKAAIDNYYPQHKEWFEKMALLV